ncbi:hypothetical protein AAE02nite_40600 [Adhaeribacter aerolatus]|uniref:Type IV secretion protein Rhs n=2 Tax=Adhaeribacter aerolatus TaxID=670289 RepID=A0A512B357_9BACT|nr:hypothetical protein AAE02nite_40600 [Adhaeribacter aerolatus]
MELNSEPEKENDLQKYNIIGQVKSIKTTSTNQKLEDTPGAYTKHVRKVKYNQDGYITESTDSTVKIILKYDKNGNIEEEKRYNGDKLIAYAESKYDNNGNVLERLFFEKNGNDIKNTFKWIKRYDDNNNLVEESVFDGNGSPDGKSVFKYDTNGNRIEELSYELDGKSLNYKATFTYDEKGNVKERYIKDNESAYISKFKYDDKNNCIEISELSTKFKTDDNGSIVEVKEPATVKEVKYKYDEKGNWTKLTVTVPEESTYPVSIEERVIEYY